LLSKQTKELLKPLPGSLTLIISIGNALRGDDGVGHYIAEKLKTGIKNLTVIDASDQPENIIDSAISLKPARTIFIDAANFEGQSGEARIINPDTINDAIFSTHTFPLQIIAKIIAEDTRASVYLIGIQPKNLDFGEGLSEEVQKTADEIISAISD
jgi:hydrogenase 3 maturation protease